MKFPKRLFHFFFTSIWNFFKLVLFLCFFSFDNLSINLLEYFIYSDKCVILFNFFVLSFFFLIKFFYKIKTSIKTKTQRLQRNTPHHLQLFIFAFIFSHSNTINTVAFCESSLLLLDDSQFSTNFVLQTNTNNQILLHNNNVNFFQNESIHQDFFIDTSIENPTQNYVSIFSSDKNDCLLKITNCSSNSYTTHESVQTLLTIEHMHQQKFVPNFDIYFVIFIFLICICRFVIFFKNLISKKIKKATVNFWNCIKKIKIPQNFLPVQNQIFMMKGFVFNNNPSNNANKNSTHATTRTLVFGALSKLTADSFMVSRLRLPVMHRQQLYDRFQMPGGANNFFHADLPFYNYVNRSTTILESSFDLINYKLELGNNIPTNLAALVRETPEQARNPLLVHIFNSNHDVNRFWATSRYLDYLKFWRP